jgi:Tfp pilus assembly protein PilV
MATSRVNRRAEAGFTMIEVLIAVLITVVAVMGIVGLITVETRSGTASRHTTEAAVLAEGQMETLRITALAVSGTGNDAAPVDAEGVAGNSNSIFTRAWSWTVGASSISYTVTVTWNEDGPTKTVKMISQRGL